MLQEYAEQLYLPAAGVPPPKSEAPVAIVTEAG
jgi:hypothetical protein